MFLRTQTITSVLMSIGCLIAPATVGFAEVQPAEKPAVEIKLPKGVQWPLCIAFAQDDKTLAVGGCPLSKVASAPPDLFKHGRIVAIDIAEKREINGADTGIAPTGIHPFADGETFLVSTFAELVYQFSHKKPALVELEDVVARELALCAETSEFVSQRWSESPKVNGFRLGRVEPGNAKTKQIMNFQSELNERCAPVAISDDGKTLAICAGKGFFKGDDTALRVFRRDQPGKYLIEVRYPTCIGPLTFSRDGKLLAVAGPHGQVGLWDVAKGMKLWVFAYDKNDEGHDYGPRLSFSSDMRFLAAANWGSVLVIDVRSGKVARTIAFPKRFPEADFSHEGMVLATAGDRDGTGGKIELWDLRKHENP